MEVKNDSEANVERKENFRDSFETMLIGAFDFQDNSENIFSFSDEKSSYSFGSILSEKEKILFERKNIRSKSSISRKSNLNI